MRACEIYKYEVPQEITQVDPALNAVRPHLRDLILRTLAGKRNMKAKLTMNVRFVKEREEGAEAPELDDVEGVNVLTVPFGSSMKSMRYMSGEERQQMDEMEEQVTENLDTFNSNGSGWVIGDILSFDVQINECLPLQGACSSHDVVYKPKSGIIVTHGDASQSNVQLGGERCFYRAVAKALMSEEGQSRPTERDLEEYIKNNICENVPTPVNVKDIGDFEVANRHLDIGINVMHKSDFSKEVFPCRATPRIIAKNMVNLLLFHTSPKVEADGDGVGASGGAPQDTPTGEEPMPIMHYAWIPDICSVLGSSMRSKNGNMYKHKKELCYNCFNHFHNFDALVRHVRWCHQEKGQKKTLPNEGECVFYQGTSKEIMIPNLFVFDFETLQQPAVKKCTCPPEKQQSCKHKTTIVSEQMPIAYSLVMVDRTGKVLENLKYVGKDAATHFIVTLVEMSERYKEYVTQNYEPLIVTESVQKAFDAAIDCYLCEKPLDGNGKVMDHDHLTGEYLGAAHNTCNLHRAEHEGKMVGFAHNFSGYDSHIIMRAVAAMKTTSGDIYVNDKKLSIDAIPLNTQKFKIMKLNDILLMDSMSFLNDSLERLVQNLKASKHKFELTKSWVKDDSKLELLTRKGIYPYEYIDCMERLEERELPPPEAFSSLLSASAGASPEDYAHAQNVWKTFGCKNLQDYTELYCTSDAFLLLECVTELRQTLYEEFRLDMCHYFSLPMMAKEMLFKKTGAKVELMTDLEMINMVRQNIRGGLSFVNQRHFCVEEESKKRKEPVSLVYLDAVS